MWWNSELLSMAGLAAVLWQCNRIKQQPGRCISVMLPFLLVWQQHAWRGDNDGLAL